MPLQNVYLQEPWGVDHDPSKPAAQRFFEAYGEAVRTRTFGQDSMTKWYSSKSIYRSETGKVFQGADEMLAWMKTLFFSFERVHHVNEYYLQIDNPDGSFRVHVGARRQLWLKGNHGEEPDTETPMAWVTEIGPADEADGYLGLQFKKTSLYWDKTKTVQMLGQALPSDS